MNDQPVRGGEMGDPPGEDNVSRSDPLRALLAESHELPADQVGEAVARAARSIGAIEVEIYLIDYSQTLLVPLRAWTAGGGAVSDEQVARVDGTLVGRAFMSQRPVEADGPDGVQRWIPMLDGTERLGVLALTLPSISEAIREMSSDIAALGAELLVAKGQHTDVYAMVRRRRRMSLAGELQWQQLPTLTARTSAIEVAGIVEPAYDVGGDAFDYSFNGDHVDLLVFDAVGHDLSAALASALVMASLRHSRRHGLDLIEAIAAGDEAIASMEAHSWFATAQVARLEISTGRMRWVNAGHPLPLLMRGGHVVGEIDCAPRPPLGLGHLSARECQVAEVWLQPGDRLLFYSDGVTEGGRRGGEQFGSDRLIDLLERAQLDDLDASETVRRLAHAVLNHADYELHDDATLLLVAWNGPAAAVAV